MAKENNQFQVDYAYPGVCSLCHTEIAEFRGSWEVAPGQYRPVVGALKANFRSRNVILSDETIMTISLCDKCNETFSDKDFKRLMASEHKGWEEESKIMHFEKPEDKKAHLTKVKSLSVKRLFKQEDLKG